MGAWQHEQTSESILWRISDVSGRPAYLLQTEKHRAGFDRLPFLNSTNRTHDLDPTPVEARLHSIDFVETIVAVLFHPQLSRLRVKCHSERIADTIGEDVLDVGAGLPTYLSARTEERIVCRSRA